MKNLFQKRAAKRWLLVGLLLFTLYNLFFILFPFEKKNIPTNKERAEEYIYSTKRYSSVFLGSGLIGDFTEESLGYNRFFNLYLPFNGSCTGIEIVALSGKIPDTLFVEINTIYKGFDRPLIKALFQPGYRQIKTVLPVLQTKYKPHVLLAEQLRSAFKMKKVRHLPSAPLPASLYLAALQMHQNTYRNLADTLKIARCVDSLKYFTDLMTASGCVIYFFEVPVDKSILNSPLSVYQRKLLKQKFGDSSVKWIEADTLNAYRTHDGIHLLNESVRAYIKHFNKNLALTALPSYQSPQPPAP